MGSKSAKPPAFSLQISGQVLSFSSLNVEDSSLGLRGASRCPNGLKLEKETTPGICDGHESRRWREGASTRQNTEIMPDRTQRVVYYFSLAYFFSTMVAHHKRIAQGKGVALFEILRSDDVNFYRDNLGKVLFEGATVLAPRTQAINSARSLGTSERHLKCAPFNHLPFLPGYFGHRYIFTDTIQ